MPQSRQSLRLTERYRSAVVATRKRLQADAERSFPTVETLDGTNWPERMAAAVAQAQTEAVRLAAGYLGAYLTSETGKATRAPLIDTRNYAGKARDGRPLAESMRSPIIAFLAHLKRGRSAAEARSRGLERALRTVGVDYDNAHHSALLATIESDERFDGWQRSLAGTCGACAAIASGISHDPFFEVHPGCQCVAAPQVVGTRNVFPILTGLQIFHDKTPEEQDEMLGPEAAEAVRNGDVRLEELHGKSELDEAPDFITQRPLQEVKQTTTQ